MRGVGLIASRYELVREIGSTAEVLRWEAFDSALERRVLLEFPRQDVGADSASRERFWQGARASARGSTVTGQRVAWWRLWGVGTDYEVRVDRVLHGTVHKTAWVTRRPGANDRKPHCHRVYEATCRSLIL